MCLCVCVCEFAEQMMSKGWNIKKKSQVREKKWKLSTTTAVIQVTKEEMFIANFDLNVNTVAKEIRKFCFFVLFLRTCCDYLDAVYHLIVYLLCADNNNYNNEDISHDIANINPSLNATAYRKLLFTLTKHRHM